ncbi:unconventional myosin-Va-like isoform X4 [Pomacea canaliculata]|uniref:unconventional myosin-Va-like isoform X4 n=1 Tax=Pomacea canaliculata TaxID=400727 RepID=UPI000D72BD72|nr:unconventional myosin-Va-like isoform X4 [Pomacea canaliculata]
MSTAELYTKGARIWIPDPDHIWRAAELLEDYKGQNKIKIQYEEGEFFGAPPVRTVFGRTQMIDSGDNWVESAISISDTKLPHLRNPEILIGENDLTSLSYLNEPEVLYNLKVRFLEQNLIYTYCGIVLVAINPYEYLEIYGNDIIHAYSGQDMGAMDPHIYAVAEEAFKQMSRFEQNQSIIVSGESGAGKTVSAKYAMRYFAMVGGSQADEQTQVEAKVLASNPIMEAIGNAKTTRNDNSSRFGKYIEISFNKQHAIIGANMRTYLLEKSRVVFQASEERNYHIFYQLCDSADDPEYEKFELGSADDFFYTSQGGAPVIKGVDDAAELKRTREAFTMLGFSGKNQMLILQIISAILHFGNVHISEKEGEACEIPANDKALTTTCKLLGIQESQMRMWLCHRKIETVGETLTKPLSESQAAFGRDALVKHIYSRVFDWIVTHINKNLRSTVKVHKFIGVLDIYGFETFQVNSFEQFCINYANEKLQQIFNMHVFKLEQEEYVREAIEWSFIDFYDNQPCIDLIESKLGILDLLDEECKMPKGSDANWCQKLYDKHLKKSKHFDKPRTSNMAFIINHFADRVEYQAEGFLEKNRDTVLEEQVNILKASEFELVAELFTEEDNMGGSQGSSAAHGRKRTSSTSTQPIKAQPKGASKQHKKTVGSQFRESLHLLMETLNATTPHYIRCIKPNDSKESFSFDPKRAVEQLRACGVLETIRISAAGYPSRWTYAEFFQRYRVLATFKLIVKNNMRKTCEAILPTLIADEEKYRFGKTKIFFRAGQVAYLEKLRGDKLKACGVMIQKHIRGWLQRRKYRRIHRSALLLQTYGRGLLARRKALYLRRTKAAINIQTMWRCYRERKAYRETFKAIVVLQAHIRAQFARRQYRGLLEEHKAVLIQAHIRAFLMRRKFRLVLRGIILVQSHYRRRKARLQLKLLKIEAKSVEHIKVVNKGLENKIIELQQKLDERAKELNVLKDQETTMKQLKVEMERLKSSDEVAKVSSNKVLDLEDELARLRAELEVVTRERDRAVREKIEMMKENEEVLTSILEEKMSLKEQLEEANRRIKLQESNSEDFVKDQVEAAKRGLIQEFEAERSHHQRLVKEHARLQQRLENLQGEMQVLTSPTGHHHRTPSDISAISTESFASSADTEKREDDEDQGYDTAKRKGEAVRKVPSFSEKSPAERLAPKKTEDVDVGLLLKLQNKVKDLEKDRARLLERLEKYEDEGGPGESGFIRDSAFDALKMQELENEKDKLKREVERLMKSIAATTNFGDNGGQVSPAAKEFLDQGSLSRQLAFYKDQFEAMTDELERRREECLQLRAMMADRMITMHSIAKESYGGQDDIVNEDNELEMAYKTQKDLNRLLQNQLENVEKELKRKDKAYQQELVELRKENERQQKLIGQQRRQLKRNSLTLGPEAKIEATMQHEITRMTAENLDLRETIDKQSEQIRKLKKMLKIYAKKLKDGEGLPARWSWMTTSVSVTSEIAAEIAAELEQDEKDKGGATMGATVKLRERTYMGMFEYRREDEGALIKNLILELKPKVAAGLIPGLPSYVLFMCVRHTDYINDDDKVKALLTGTINGIKKVVKKHTDDLERVTLWLANTCRLMHTLKQYSGDKQFQVDNQPRQNEMCLRNFDLSEYRQVFSDLAIWIYQTLIKFMQELLQPSIVPAILEHEAIAGLTASKPSGLRGRSSSNARDLDDGKEDAHSLDALMRTLNSYMRILTQHAVDPELVKQIFRQLYYFMCAGALNNLLLRKDMCNWSKGMQIRYNLSHMEQWLRDNKLQESGAQLALDPIVQASQLLQARKTDSDVESICEMCSKLTIAQIIKILNLYTPVDEFEERVPISFIRKIQSRLKSRPDAAAAGSNTLLMDTKFTYPVTFPFNPSSILLDSVEVPEQLHLGFLKKL